MLLWQVRVSGAWITCVAWIICMVPHLHVYCLASRLLESSSLTLKSFAATCSQWQPEGACAAMNPWPLQHAGWCTRTAVRFTPAQATQQATLLSMPSRKAPPAHTSRFPRAPATLRTLRALFTHGTHADLRFSSMPACSGSAVRYQASHGAQLIEATATTISFKFYAVGNVLVDCYQISKASPGTLAYSTCMPAVPPPPPVLPVFSLLTGVPAGSLGPGAAWL